MKLILMVLIFGLSGCITTHSEGFVNYKAIGDLYGTKPQTVDYEEVGQMRSDASGHFWNSCDQICKEALYELKYLAKDRGGDTVIDLNYERGDSTTNAPSCSTHWSWAYLYILPVLGPWVKTCDVQGVVVARNTSRYKSPNPNESIRSSTPNININVNNNSQNGSQEPKPSH